jgi:hypothetical protein
MQGEKSQRNVGEESRVRETVQMMQVEVDVS